MDALAPELPPDRRWLVRVLGARLVTQNVVVLLAPEPRVVRAAATVELLHAASMLPVLLLPRYRRAAWISGGIAAAYAGLAPASSGAARCADNRDGSDAPAVSVRAEVPRPGSAAMGGADDISG